MGGDERLRLFLAYVLPADALVEISAWQERELRGGRAVPPGNLHVTLAFLGSRPAGELEGILGLLEAAARQTHRPRFTVVGYRETRAVGMLTLRDESGAALPFAASLHEQLAALGVYRPERRSWLPHVTVLRFRERPGLRPQLPRLAAVVPSDAAAFLSRLHPSGARYEVLKSFPLGG